jgi:hypothetical protein
MEPQEQQHQVATTDVWGPALWRAIHFIALGYPSVPTEADAVSYRAFFESLDKVIPCAVCASNYRRHMDEIPIDGYLLGVGRGSGGKTLFEWTVELHNVVDRELGKAGPDWTPARAKEALFAGRWTIGAASGQLPHPAPHPAHLPLDQVGAPWQLLLLAALLAAAAIAAAVAMKRSGGK